MQSLISNISHIYQEIYDIKRKTKPRSIANSNKYTKVHLELGNKTNPSYTLEQDSSNSAKMDNGGRDGLGDICSSHNIPHHHSPNNPDNSLHHAPAPPSLLF